MVFNGAGMNSRSEHRGHRDVCLRGLLHRLVGKA